MVLSAAQLSFYEQNGYLVVEDFWPPETVAKLRAAMDRVVSGLDFSTGGSLGGIYAADEQVQISDEYLYASASAISFFWESKAKEYANGSDPKLELSKLGHALHDLDPDFRAVTYDDDRIKSIAVELGMTAPKAVQSMFIFKQPGMGGKWEPHQDGTYIASDPHSCLGFWWALDPCTQQNGCLWVVPGSHAGGVDRIYQRKDTQDESQGTEFVYVDKAVGETPYDLTGSVPLQVGSGALVLLHHALVHYSGDNASDTSRHAWTVHVVDDAAEYSPGNWLQRDQKLPFRLL